MILKEYIAIVGLILIVAIGGYFILRSLKKNIEKDKK